MKLKAAPMIAVTTISEAACTVLHEAEPAAKAALSRAYAAQWRAGLLDHQFNAAPPDRPGRPAKPELLAPNRMPKRGRGGSQANRIALLHALAHIEFNAIDLAWDVVARFGAGQPRSYVEDWVQVGDDEARHFGLLCDRLAALGAAYGDLPAHDGLWDAAFATRNDPIARLAVVPMVLEARGLDVTPATVERLIQAGDPDSAAALQIIYEDEISHVRVGSRWFHAWCAAESVDPASRFHVAVKQYFRGILKPPFNHIARISADLLPAYYEPLAI
jgi:uncharacterized ferritin-like protein (DUF455 family)